MMNIEVASVLNPEDETFISRELWRYNAKFIKSDSERLSVFCRDAEGSIVGGLRGGTILNWLEIKELWISENMRGNSLGSKLIKSAEDEAIKRQCVGSVVDTFSFQALGFYQKMGYTLMGSLDGYSGKYQRHYLYKSLAA